MKTSTSLLLLAGFLLAGPAVSASLGHQPVRRSDIAGRHPSLSHHHYFGDRVGFEHRTHRKRGRSSCRPTQDPVTVSNTTVVSADPNVSQVTNATSSNTSSSASGTCFPGSGKSAPSIPNAHPTASSLSTWWCDEKTEYSFLGFSYDLTGCPSLSTLTTDFNLMRQTYKARYVRLYGACDPTFDTMNNVVEAAASAGIGVYAIVWFGFDGDDKWKTRMSDLIKVVNTNQKAPYVIRNIAVGSEPLFDQVLSPDQLAAQIKSVKSQLKAYDMQVTLSDMPYGFQSNGDAPSVFAAVDILEINTLPFFDTAATTGDKAWPFVSWTISYMKQHGPGKLVRMTQTGWPSNDSIWKANTPTAVASVTSEQAYFDLLDQHCSDLKDLGVGWFAQIFSDDMLSGWGVLDDNHEPKFPFKPKTSC